MTGKENNVHENTAHESDVKFVGKVTDCNSPVTGNLNFPPIFYKHGRIDKNYLTVTSRIYSPDPVFPRSLNL